MISTQTKKQFRLDIQSLRALAVIAVLLYHFKFDKIMGGFVGVDVFFVISGYLISRSILNTQERNNFSFSTFYFNRVKRLYPALLATIFATYIAGFFIFNTFRFEELSNTSIFASLGLSNIYFWLTSGYFDTFSAEKPLLHTWSLSVEFQFYLIWPVILLLIAKRKIWQLPVTIGVTLLSGILAYIYLFKDSDGAFYLTPFRIHEFSIGAVVFLLEDRFKFGKLINTIIVLAGYLLIFIALLTFDSNRIAFPGIYVWVPVIGSALIIFAGSSTYLSKILNFKPFVFIGEISYSLYLVHWPLFVFFVSYHPFDYPSSLRNQLIVYSFVGAIALYYLIEKPFRNNVRNVSPDKYTLICQSVVIGIIALSSASIIGNGWIWRLPENAQKVNNFNIEDMYKFTWARQEPYYKKQNFYNNGKEKILVIGDSQAADVINMLYESEKIDHFDFIYRKVATECGLPYLEEEKKKKFYADNPFIATNPDTIKLCENQFKEVLSQPNLFTEADKIVLAFGWRNIILPYLNSALNKISELSDHQSNKIWIVGLKFFSESGIDIFNQYNNLETKEISFDNFTAFFKSPPSTELESELKNYKDSHYIDMYEIICSAEDLCKALTDDGVAIMYDVGHFTPEGAKYLGDKFYKQLTRQ